MKICVVGLGSMGRRRLRILSGHFAQHRLFGVDSNPERRAKAREEFGIEVFQELRDAEAVGLDAFFVCTSPQAHASVFSGIDLDRYHTFSELDLLKDGYERLIAAEYSGAKRHFLSSTPIYDLESRYIIEETRKAGTVGYRYHVGQYLPDWHPWESYKSFFVGKKETNGCREILAIELPWMIAAFGKVKDFQATRTRLSSLELDYPDTWNITLFHESGCVGQVLVDVVCRYPVHELEVYSENFYVTWNGRPNGIQRWNEKGKSLEAIRLYEKIERTDGYAETITENPYIEEVSAFFKGIEDPGFRYSFGYKESRDMLDLVDSVEGIA